MGEGGGHEPIVGAGPIATLAAVDTTALTLDDIDGRHHDVLAAIRAEQPVAWVPALDGWVVTSRELAVEVMRDPDTYTVDDPRFSTAQVVGPSMLSLDGPEQQRHRTPFAEALRPAITNARYAERIDAAAERLVVGLVPTRGGELRRGLAGPLAVAVSAMALGIEHLSAERLLALYDRIVAAVDGVARGGEVSDDGRAAFEALAAELRASMDHPGTLVADARQALTEGETVSNAAVFLFGGIETSEGMTSNLLVHLLSPDEHGRRAWDGLLADPRLVDAAVEESLRLEPAAARVDRYATTDATLGGSAIRRGDLVIVSLAAANRDPAVFEQPDRFDVHRPEARQHVTFAVGPHACIGAQLARLQARAAVQALLRHAPMARMDAPVTPAGVVFRKPDAVPVRW